MTNSLISLDRVADVSSAFKLLSDPTRLKILCLLFETTDDICVYEIAETVGISQSAASHQLSKLEAQSIVECFRDGQKICYKIKESEATKNLERVIKIFKK